jgi:hypothetical protein
MTFFGKIALATALLAAPALAQISVEAVVDEGSTVKSQLTFKNTHGSSVTPTTASYQWRSVATDAVLIPPTTIPIVGSTATVLSPPMFIPANELNANSPNTPDKITVVQVLSYSWDGGAGHKDKATYVYLRNVPGIFAP